MSSVCLHFHMLETSKRLEGDSVGNCYVWSRGSVCMTKHVFLPHYQWMLKPKFFKKHFYRREEIVSFILTLIHSDYMLLILSLPWELPKEISVKIWGPVYEYGTFRGDISWQCWARALASVPGGTEATLFSRCASLYYLDFKDLSLHSRLLQSSVLLPCCKQIIHSIRE